MKLEKQKAGPFAGRTKFNAVVDAINKGLYRAGLGITISNGVISLFGQGSGGGTGSFPFQILSAASAGDVPEVGVNFYSTIFKSLEGDDNLEITGLLALDLFSGGFEVPAIGEKIWLEITVDESPQIASAAQIRYGAVGGALWDEYPDPIAINIDNPAAPYQEFYNLLLGEVVASTNQRPGNIYTVGTEARKIVQMFDRNVQLVQWAVDGLVCLVPDNPALNFIATP